MEQDALHISRLVTGYLRNELTDEELTRLSDWRLADPDNELLFLQLTESRSLLAEVGRVRSFNEERVWKKIEEQVAWILKPDEAKAKTISMRPWRWVAAAVLVIGLMAGGVFYFNNRQPGNIVQAKEVLDVNAPQINRAMITLSDGRKFFLDDIKNGLVVTEGKTAIKKLGDGQIAYELEGQAATDKLIYNTLTNPRGSRVIDMMFSDGSHVWLNAGSSITYPVAFNGDGRRVKMEGEAYFEVTKNAAMPFIVNINGAAEVEVLGTHFNINSYADEPMISTTLLEGSVRVRNGAGALLLTPGQQAQSSAAGMRLIKDADTEQAVAWKNGLFSFNNADLPTVMRELSRWYNVEVAYEGAIPAGVLAGEIDRGLTLDQLLKGLSKTSIHYRIENGNRIIILP